jgi:hypothetical protein
MHMFFLKLRLEKDFLVTFVREGRSKTGPGKAVLLIDKGKNSMKVRP